MNKELQDLAWSVLPKEFKEEVKRQYQIAVDSKAYAAEYTLGYLFGIHNLTSDAEGEVMLTVPRKAIMQAYEKSCAKRATKYDVGYADCLYNLFGSKCLPDEVAVAENATTGNVDNPEANVDSLNGNVESSRGNVESPEPEPAEPKLKVGDYAMMNGRKVEIIGHSDHSPHKYYVHVLTENYQTNVNESDLEPYTKPEYEHQYDDTAQKSADVNSNRNLPQETADCDKEFDNILKDSFSKERRLNIAAKMLQALVCAPIISGVDPNPPAEQLAQTAFRLADALIAECEKGGN